MEAIEGDMSVTGESISITLASNAENSFTSTFLEIKSGDNVAERTQAALGLSEGQEFIVLLGEQELDLEDSFEANGVEDGARLMVEVLKITIEDFIQDLFKANPHLDPSLDPGLNTASLLVYNEDEGDHPTPNYNDLDQ